MAADQVISQLSFAGICKHFLNTFHAKPWRSYCVFWRICVSDIVTEFSNEADLPSSGGVVGESRTYLSLVLLFVGPRQFWPVSGKPVPMGGFARLGYRPSYSLFH